MMRMIKRCEKKREKKTLFLFFQNENADHSNRIINSPAQHPHFYSLSKEKKGKKKFHGSTHLFKYPEMEGFVQSINIHFHQND